ncbi:hypothetical protein, partial [[Ruminococcus] torques]
SNPARGWQANKRRTCAWLVILGLCPKMKNHPLGGWMFIMALAAFRKVSFGALCGCVFRLKIKKFVYF